MIGAANPLPGQPCQGSELKTEPYPKLAVAEFELPQGGWTSWDFSLLDPLLEDFTPATAGHPVNMNVSTLPEWMFKTDRFQSAGNHSDKQ